MVRHTTKDDEVFISEERQREQQAVWGRSRSSNSRGGPGGRGGGGSDKEDQARERMDNIRVYSLIFLLKASQADPSTMPAMVEAGAISGLLMHLATAADCTSSSSSAQQQQQQEQQQRTPKKQEADSARAGGVFEQRHHGTDENAADGGGDQIPPSLLLAARLLYAISLNPGGRCAWSLLEAKSLPPLIRLRRQLHAKAAAEATATAEASATTAAIQPALECTKRPAGTNSGSAAFARKGGTEEVEKDAFIGNQQAQHSGGDVATGDSSSEPDVEGIEVIVSLIVDQLVGRSNGRRKNRVLERLCM
ncbi:unnamed protein product [Ectocarpus sp. 12 AP-2014]